jgi:hypothetical protein
MGSRVLRGIYTPDRDLNGNVHGWIESIIDISDRADALRVRKQLASIVDSSDDAIVSEPQWRDYQLEQERRAHFWILSR